MIDIIGPPPQRFATIEDSPFATIEDPPPLSSAEDPSEIELTMFNCDVEFSSEIAIRATDAEFESSIKKLFTENMKRKTRLNFFKAWREVTETVLHSRILKISLNAATMNPTPTKPPFYIRPAR